METFVFLLNVNKSFCCFCAQIVHAPHLEVAGSNPTDTGYEPARAG